ncbi:MAG TPA: hypothetical protein DCM14_07270 [Clostridiales bacterium UBA8153]|nr:hypothetical protein [Clostridiales bacterium UBA8153]
MELTFEEVTRELIAALAEESAAAEAAAPGGALALREGRRAGGSAAYHRYSFLLDHEPDVPSDSRALLQVGHEQHPAEVLGIQGHDISLAVRADLGAAIPFATLLVSAHFVLEVLSARLAGMLSSGEKHNSALAMAGFGLGPYPPPSRTGGDQTALTGLNPEQREAVIDSWGKAVSFIWGPPGTGKTLAVGKLVQGLMKDERVLVTSHTNVAVDTALLAVLKGLPEGDRECGCVLRVGPPQRGEACLAAITLEEVLQRQAGSLLRQRADLAEQRRRLVSRFAGSHGASLPALSGDCSDSLPNLERAEHATVQGELAAVEACLAGMDAQIEAERRRIVSQARVLGTTLSRLALADILSSLVFDTTVVDEASTVPLPFLWYAASRTQKRLVCAGDFRQLPPVVRADDPRESPAAAKWLTPNIFEQAGVVSGRGDISAGDRRLSKLHKQYRMHPVIGELANRLAYGDRPLEHMGAPSHFLPATRSRPRPGLAVVFCDTTHADPWCARPETGWSRYNLLSALVSMQVARTALGDAARDAAVITPYRAQARLLQAHIESVGLDRQRIQAATVHRFQGEEKDVIVLDLVDSPPFGVGKLLRGGFASTAMQLLNVACTRAKGKLIIVGHRSHLEMRVGPHDSLRAVLEYPGPYRQLDALEVVEDALTCAGSPALRMYAGDDFRGDFIRDLQGASSGVVLVSPHARVPHLAELAPPLLLLADRGVPVMLLTTRPGSEERGYHVLLELASHRGVEVRFRTSVQQRMAFIDGRVAYFGSSHVLSPTYWGGRMLRLCHDQLVERMMEVAGATAWVRSARQRSRQEAVLELVEPYLVETGERHRCGNCGRELRLHWGRFGPFWGCRFQHSTVSVPVDAITRALGALALPCPECSGIQQLIGSGRRYPVLGCSRWPQCRWYLAREGRR